MEEPPLRTPVTTAEPLVDGPQPLLRNRRWMVLAAVLAVTCILHLYGLGKWPWGTDEVSSLLELGLLDPSIKVLSKSPDNLSVRLPRVIPVWYCLQGAFLRVVPPNELTTRILAATCGILTVMFLYMFGLRRRGMLFAVALVMLVNGSQLFVWLSQQNRYYTMAVMFSTLALISICARSGNLIMVPATAVCTLLAVLSHNLLVTVFGLAFGCACVAWLCGWATRTVLIRSGVSAAVAAAVYFFYLRAIIGNWSSYGFGETNNFVSFVAHVGIPTLALSFLGVVIALATSRHRSAMAFWAGLAIAVILFVAAAPLIVPAWNPRYAVLFVLPIWVTAAFAVEHVACRLRGRLLTVAWYATVGLLLLPKLASHYMDGSRHDFRQAAITVSPLAGEDVPIFSNLVLRTKYYLPQRQRPQVHVWEPNHELPPRPAT